MLTLFLLLHYLNGQPCASPVTLIGTTQTSGVCTPPVPGASLIKFPYATLGATTDKAVKFSVTFWLKPPNAPTLGGKTYAILRVSTDTSDTIPTTPDGIRLAVYFSLDSINRGFYLGYSESPSDPILYTDITQMAAAYTGDWMFIYAGLDYTVGELKISTWEMKQIFWQQKKFFASKVNFNTQLNTNTAIEALYWGSQDSFCGDIKKLKWMPNYYETNDENIFKLPYFLEGKTNAGCYLYRFDKVDKNTVTNLASSGTLTLQQNMKFTFYEMDSSHPVLTIPTAKWTTSTNSYTFGTYILQKSLPQFGADIILLQRVTSGAVNLFSIKLALQSNGKLGILLTFETVQKLVAQFDCQVDKWYFIQVSIAFAGSLQSQVNTLSHYHIVAPDGSILSGYSQITYTATISTKYTGLDKCYIGDLLNPYQGIIQLRLLRFEEGFQVFMNSPCQTDCTIGRYSLTPAENYCFICSLSAKLDSTFLCSTSDCSSNYYLITDMTSHNFCAFCDSAQSYYVNPSQVCIQAACGNGYKEPPAENCDDNGTVDGDGCSSTCLYEKGYNCSPATDYELTTCVIYCGNGVRDEVLTPPALSFTEECDDGNNVLNDGCSNCKIDTDLWECGYSFPSQCTLLCGNAKLNNDGALLQTEQCDDGNTSNGDGCDSSCQIETDWMCSAVPLQMSACILICGNGTLDAGEQCDDGNVMDNDGCTACVIDAGWDCSGTICTKYCGNGVKDVIPLKSINEICDDGNTIQYDGCYLCLVEIGWTCDASSPSQCHMCGNSKKEPYETCDDGNTVSLDGCSNTCQLEASWTCNGGNPDICNNCGDGKKQQIEDCDDGNASLNDGCTNCKVDIYYECSGGSPTSPDICVKTCPNGIVSGSEECDDGNNTSGDGCYLCVIAMGFVCDNQLQPSVCTVDVCGNGKSHSLSEECDDGNLVDGDGCDSKCKIEDGWDCSTKIKCVSICGDSKKVVGVEECDDGNLIDGDGCNGNCKVELSYSCDGGDITKKDICTVTCGNNVRDAKEECDDGNIRNGDGCSNLCLIETSFGCSQVLMQDNVTRDECYPCISNCAMCTDTDIDGCQLCYHGYYKSETQCTDNCGDNYYADPFMQACLNCGDNCVRCYNNAQCFRCNTPYVLDGTQCVQKCSNGYYIKEHELKGQWCKKCPLHCTVCETETLCTSCEDYYSPLGSCKYCDMGELCLACDFELNTCIKCKLGFRPIEDKCIKIQDKCGDGLVSINEKCDDGNLANDDGCNRECIIEEGANCRLVQNEGPSECFDTLGWEFELHSFILDPQLIQLTFTDQIKYDDVIIKNISTLFTLSINGFTEQDYSYQFVNNSGSNKTISIQFTFLKNVVSQTLTVTLKDQTKLTNYYDIKIDPDKITKSIDLEDKEFYTQSQIDFFTLLRNLAYGLQILNWILVIGAGFLDQQYRIWKTIEILQVICTLYYMNLRSYPLNSELLLVDLRYSNLYILPNFLQQYTDEYLLSLRRFSMAGLTYQVINNTGGLFLFYLAISLVVYAFTKIVYHRYVLYVFEVFLDKLEFSYFFKFYEVFLLELLISCLHNVRYNSMASNWSGTNTVIALILLLLIILIQVSLFLIAFFRDYFGTEVEVKSMFGTLTDGCNDNDRKRRVFMSQQDFVKKVFIAYAMIYVDDPFQQMLLIVVPRAVLSIVSCFIMKNWFLRVKEIFSELLLYGIISQSYMLALGDFIGDLDKKVFYGSLWVYMVLALEFMHGICNTYLVWRLLYVLESTLPEDVDPNAGINKKIDLFKQRGAKKERGKTQKELQEEEDRKARLEEAKRKKKQAQELALKNQNREKWNVWNMQREAKPEERRFVSIKHNEFGDVLEPIQPSGPKQNQKQNDELNNLDDFDQMDNFFGNPSKIVTNKSQVLNQSNQQIKAPSLNQTQQMNQTQQNQMNQTMNKTMNQTINQNLNQTQKSQNIAQQWLVNDTQQPLFQDQSFKPASAAQQQQKSQMSAFQFQQDALPKKDAPNDSEQESMNNDNPFDF